MKHSQSSFTRELVTHNRIVRPYLRKGRLLGDFYNTQKLVRDGKKLLSSMDVDELYNPLSYNLVFYNKREKQYFWLTKVNSYGLTAADFESG